MACMKYWTVVALLAVFVFVGLAVANVASGEQSQCCYEVDACCQECTTISAGELYAKRDPIGFKLWTGDGSCYHTNVTCPKLKYYSDSECLNYTHQQMTPDTKPRCAESGGSCNPGV